jgi:hypothetical protein
MNQLFRIAYISAASKSFDPAELREMRKESNARNKEAGITGMLLYKDGQFMQVFEGHGGSRDNHLQPHQQGSAAS